MTSDNSIQNWIDAKELFEKYIDQPINESLRNVKEDKDIPHAVKLILFNLINSQNQDDTIIDKADLSFFQSIDKEVEDLSGKSIGEYRLIQRIGQGGMSNVYKAKRKGHDIQKFVALKLLTSIEGELSDTLIQLFKREQVTLSKLNHPNIISFHHGGISQNNIPFLVMDYIDGAKTINHYVSENQLSIRDIVILIKKVADAINHAHQNLIIHKDIKPNNVLIDQLGMPKVVDFGIASFNQLETEDDSHLTALIFTPDYASPEQIKNTNITANSDVFSLAALLLELISKQKPLPEYDGLNINKDDYDQHIKVVLSQTELPQDLNYIITKAMQFDNKDRYQSMLGFADDLDALMNKRPIAARKQSKGYIISKYISRNPGFSLAILAFAISAIIGVITTIQQKNNAQLEALKAKQVSDFLINSIQVNDPDINKGKEVTVKELLLNAQVNIQETSFNDQSLSSTLEQTIGSALAKIGQFIEAENLLQQAIESDNNNFDAHIALAHLYLNQQYFDKAEELLNYLTNNKDLLSQVQSIQQQQLTANLMFHNGNFDAAIEIIRATINSPNITSKQLIDSQFIYSRFLNENGENQKSIDILYQALKVSNKDYSETSTSSTNILYRIANVYSDMNPLPEEKIHQVYSQTINNQTIIYGDNHPYLAKTYLRYGFALKIFGEYKKSRDMADSAMKVALSNFDENHMLTARSNILLSQLSIIDNKIDSAIPQLENAVKIYENQYGVDHFETNQIKTTLAGYYLKAGQGDKALKMLEPLYELQKKQFGETNKATIYAKMNIIKAHGLKGDHQLAINEGLKLLTLSQKNLGKEAILTVGVQMGLAESFLNTNNNVQSIQLSEELLTFSIVDNNYRYKQKVTDLLNQALENKTEND